MSGKIVCVTPTIRPERMEQFRKAWSPLFEKYQVTLITVWDGESPTIEYDGTTWKPNELPIKWSYDYNKDLFYRFTDSCRNLGFVAAARLNPDYVLTLDDDVTPLSTGMDSYDPIRDHLTALSKRVPISWMNTAHMSSEYLRGVPYEVRNEAPVMLSHGVWTGIPDFDGETQLRLEKSALYGESGYGVGIPYTLPYYVGPVPKGVLFPICGMNVMIRKEALPYFYFAPMGKDTGLDLNRFGDIWMGIYLKQKFDELGWAVYTGASTVHHTRASDARKNFEQEKLGREWNEYVWKLDTDNEMITGRLPTEAVKYMVSYMLNRKRYAELISGILNKE